jgi:hypothetical protein
MMKRCNGSSRSKICSEDGTSTDDHHLVRELVHELQTELAGSGDHDGGSGDLLAVARLSGAQTRLNQKDLKSATIQTAPVMRKVKPGEKARGASPDGRALIGLCQCVGMG